MPFFKTCPPNQHGDDFVVGDLHGRGQQLLDKLAALGFDPAADRVFCTGDLVDRSEHSFETLELLLGQPWFHFVRGNHDDDLSNFIDFEFSRFPGWRPSYCDQEWLYGLQPDQVERLKTVYLPILADASMVLRVEGPHGFWMVHADRSKFARYVEPIPLLSDADLPSANSEPQLESFMWSRRLFKQIPHADLIDRGLFLAAERDEVTPNAGLTFVGHSIVKQPILYRSHLFIDTGEHPDGPGLTVLRVKDVLESRPSKALEKHLGSIPAIVAAHRCANPRVFGSVLRGEDHFGSDLDILVDPTKGTTLLNLAALKIELTQLLQVRVQVVTPGTLPEKWRQQVLGEARPLDRLLIDSTIKRFDEVLKGLVERDGQG